MGSKGYAVDHIKESALAPAKVRSGNYDLLITDVVMEEADSGIELTKTLGSEFPNLPIIILSSIVNPSEDVMSMLDLPARRILQKPLMPEQLIAEVEEILAPAQ